MPLLEDTGRHVTRIGPLNVLFVMATEHEYGPHLRRRIDPLMTGVGPVEAAADLSVALTTLHHKAAKPDLVFTLGSAGSRSLDNAAVYQMKSVAYRDIDASLLGFEKGVTPFADHPAVIEIPHLIPGIPSASLSTGGAIISGVGYDAIDADMVDMESYAVLRAARRFGIPTIGLRGISDGKADLTGLHDWTEYLHIIDEKLAEAIDAFAGHVEGGSFRLDHG
jgi:adenosylhomocysteine nucleosidase